MKKGYTLAIAFLVVINITPIGSYGDIYPEPLTVIVTYPDEEYSIGDEVVINAHVFMNSERFDPDVIELEIGTDAREMTPVRVSTGLYEAKVVIIESEITEWSGRYLRINTGVSISDPGEQFDWDHTRIDIGPQPPLLVVKVFGPNDYHTDSNDGHVLNYLITISYDGELVDPDPGSLEVEIRELGSTTRPELEARRIAKGMFVGSYTLPEDNDEAIHWIFVLADYSVGGKVLEQEGGKVVTYTPFQVWANYHNQGDKRTSFHIFVHDGNEMPVVNAGIWFNATYRTKQWDDQSFAYSQRTDEEGVAHFLVSYQDIDPYSDGFYIRGEIKKDTITQRLVLYIPNQNHLERNPSSDDGLEVFMVNEEPLKEGTNMTLDFIATYKGTLLRGELIACYFYTDQLILMNSEEVTDEEGQFQVELLMPKITSPTPAIVPTPFDWYSQIQCLFKVKTENGTNKTHLEVRTSQWDSPYEYDNNQSPETYLELTRIDESARYKVQLISNDLDGINESVWVNWMIGEFDKVVNWTNPGWYHGGKWSYDSLDVELSWNGVAYSGYIQLPDFIPIDVLISLYGSVTMVDDPAEPVRYALIGNSTSYIENRPPEVEIQSPKDGERVHGTLKIKGTANDDILVKSVLVRIDGGEWELVTGTDVWQSSIDLDTFSEGIHKIEAISFDGMRYSETDEIGFDYSTVEPQTAYIWPIIIVVIIAVTIISYFIIKRKYPKRNEHTND